MRITAIQIAAGLSSRMGGPNKLLQEIEEEKTLVQHTFTELQASNVDDVVVVTGRDSIKVNDELNSMRNEGDDKSTTIVFNPNFEKGMTTSIQVGLNEAKESDAIMICLSDMPLLATEDYNELLASYVKADNQKAILAPFWGNRKGNPVIFGSEYFQAIAEHTEMNGCASIIKANNEQLIRFETQSEHYFFDIDTPETLADYRARVK